jgi:NAD+ kinase
MAKDKVLGVAANWKKAAAKNAVKDVLGWAKRRGWDVIIEGDLKENMGLEAEAEPYETLRESVSFMVALGGDGTLLHAARNLAGTETPILGVNLGSLGFLTECYLEELTPALDKLDGGEYGIETRLMVQAVATGEDNRKVRLVALNEVVIDRDIVSRVIELALYVQDEYIGSFIADGLIVSTPTGSTAYSLAAGGPIVTPGLGAFVATPLCPHTLSARPIIIPSDHKLRVVASSDSARVKVTADGQVEEEMGQRAEIVVSAASERVSLVKVNFRSFYQLLRTKFSWADLGDRPVGK